MGKTTSLWTTHRAQKMTVSRSPHHGLRLKRNWDWPATLCPPGTNMYPVEINHLTMSNVLLLEHTMLGQSQNSQNTNQGLATFQCKCVVVCSCWLLSIKSDQTTTAIYGHKKTESLIKIHLRDFLNEGQSSFFTLETAVENIISYIIQSPATKLVHLLNCCDCFLRTLDPVKPSQFYQMKSRSFPTTIRSKSLTPFGLQFKLVSVWIYNSVSYRIYALGFKEIMIWKLNI